MRQLCRTILEIRRNQRFSAFFSQFRSVISSHLWRLRLKLFSCVLPGDSMLHKETLGQLRKVACGNSRRKLWNLAKRNRIITSELPDQIGENILSCNTFLRIPNYIRIQNFIGIAWVGAEAAVFKTVSDSSNCVFQCFSICFLDEITWNPFIGSRNRIYNNLVVVCRKQIFLDL